MSTSAPLITSVTWHSRTWHSCISANGRERHPSAIFFNSLWRAARDRLRPYPAVCCLAARQHALFPAAQTSRSDASDGAAVSRNIAAAFSPHAKTAAMRSGRCGSREHLDHTEICNIRCDASLTRPSYRAAHGLPLRRPVEPKSLITTQLASKTNPPAIGSCHSDHLFFRTHARPPNLPDLRDGSACRFEAWLELV